VTVAYVLRCRECGKTYGVQPLSYCDECFSSLEVAFDLDYARSRFTRESIASGPLNMWRYRALLPIADDYTPQTPVGLTPLVEAPRLGAHIGGRKLYLKNDAVCMPTLSFKDRVVAVALANAQAFGFDTVGCSSTGNLANAVAAHAARLGLKTYILVPSDLESAKILNTLVYGATLVRVDGNYDHVNRLCSQIADRYNWGFVNVNLRPYYAEGSKTVGFEIAEQLGWRLPDNIVCPMAGGSLITKIRKAFKELIELGLVEAARHLPLELPHLHHQRLELGGPRRCQEYSLSTAVAGRAPTLDQTRSFQPVKQRHDAGLVDPEMCAELDLRDAGIEARQYQKAEQTGPDLVLAYETYVGAPGGLMRPAQVVAEQARQNAEIDLGTRCALALGCRPLGARARGVIAYRFHAISIFSLQFALQMNECSTHSGSERPLRLPMGAYRSGRRSRNTNQLSRAALSSSRSKLAVISISLC